MQKATYDADARPDAEPEWALDKGWMREFDPNNAGQQLHGASTNQVRASKPPTIS